MKNRLLRMPDTLVLMFMIMMVALALTWVLPAGSFETVVNDQGREVVRAGTYAKIEDASRLAPWELFTVVPRAMADVQGIIFFVLIIGGALEVICKTGDIDAFMCTVLRSAAHSKFWCLTLELLHIYIVTYPFV